MRGKKTKEKASGLQIIALKRERQFWERVLGRKALRGSPGSFAHWDPFGNYPTKMEHGRAVASVHWYFYVEESVTFHGERSVT